MSVTKTAASEGNVTRTALSKRESPKWSPSAAPVEVTKPAPIAGNVTLITTPVAVTKPAPIAGNVTLITAAVDVTKPAPIAGNVTLITAAVDVTNPAPIAGNVTTIAAGRSSRFPMHLAGLTTALLAACSAPPTATPDAHPPTWTAVTPAAAEVVVEAPAQVLADPAATAVLAPPYRATVVRVRARVGDTVDAGAPLIDVLMPELLEAAGRAEGAQARLDAWTARQRQLEQLRAEGLARALELSEATARVAEAKSDLQAARAVLVSAGVGPQQGAALLAGTGALTLRAPATGVVTRLTASPGASREPGGAPLAEVMSESTTRVEARFTRAPPPGLAEFIGSTGTVPLTELSHAPALDPRDGTLLAWFAPASPLPAGLPGRVRVKVADAGGAFTVPSASIVRLEGRAGVETRSRRVEVEVVRCGAETCVVRGALAAGDEVRSP